MSEKSFYDLDYIIQINESRLEQYMSAYQKVLERLTNIILIYSGLTIFLFPLIQDIFVENGCHWIMIACFVIFATLFTTSLVFTVRLIIPVEIAYLVNPKRYYEEYRLRYENEYLDDYNTSELLKTANVSKLLKASYIDELETALETNNTVFKKKSSFYYNALMFALLSTVPYLICLGFHIVKKDDKTQKVQIVNPEISRILQQTDSIMSKSNSKNDTKNTGTSQATGTVTKLPGVNVEKVISSQPSMVRENSKDSIKKR